MPFLGILLVLFTVLIMIQVASRVGISYAQWRWAGYDAQRCAQLLRRMTAIDRVVGIMMIICVALDIYCRYYKPGTLLWWEALSKQHGNILILFVLANIGFVFAGLRIYYRMRFGSLPTGPSKKGAPKPPDKSGE